MATDLADWTQAVNVLGGSVSISGPVTATISGVVSVSISGTPTVNIGTIPTVTITGSVSITAGTVSIGNVVSMNVTQASSLPMYSPNFLPTVMAGPISAVWANGRAFNCTLAFLAGGLIEATLTVNNGADFFDAQPNILTGAPVIRVLPGDSIYMEASFLDRDHVTTVGVAIVWLDSTFAEIGSNPARSPGTVGSYVKRTLTDTAIAGAYYCMPRLYVANGDGSINDRVDIDHIFMGKVGAVSIAGRVNVTGAVSDNPNTLLTAAAASGQAKAFVVDPTIFFPGAIVQLVSLSGNPSFLGIVKSVNSDSSITFTANLAASFVAGDAAVVLPEQLASSRKRAWDFTGFANPAQGNQALITIAAVSGQRIILNHLSAEIVNTNAAGATGVSWDVRDGGQAGTVLWISISGMQGITGDKDKFSEADLGIPNSVNNAMTCRSQVGIANATLSMSVGGYTSITEPI